MSVPNCSFTDQQGHNYILVVGKEAYFVNKSRNCPNQLILVGAYTPSPANAVVLSDFECNFSMAVTVEPGDNFDLAVPLHSAAGPVVLKLHFRRTMESDPIRFSYEVEGGDMVIANCFLALNDGSAAWMFRNFGYKRPDGYWVIGILHGGIYKVFSHSAPTCHLQWILNSLATHRDENVRFITISDYVAIGLFLEGVLTVEMLQNSIATDNEIVVTLILDGKPLSVHIVDGEGRKYLFDWTTNA